MTDIELTEQTFVYKNGVVNTYRDGGLWRSVVRTQLYRMRPMRTGNVPVAMRGNG